MEEAFFFLVGAGIVGTLAPYLGGKIGKRHRKKHSAPPESEWPKYRVDYKGVHKGESVMYDFSAYVYRQELDLSSETGIKEYCLGFYACMSAKQLETWIESQKQLDKKYFSAD